MLLGEPRAAIGMRLAVQSHSERQRLLAAAKSIGRIRVELVMRVVGALRLVFRLRLWSRLRLLLWLRLRLQCQRRCPSQRHIRSSSLIAAGAVFVCQWY